MKRNLITEMKERETWQLDREHALLLLGVAAVVTGVWLIVAPGTFPIPLETVAPLTRGEATTAAGIVLGLFILVATIARILNTAPVSLDRSAIVTVPPEAAVADDVKRATAPLDSSCRRVRRQLTNPGTPERHAAMYGRRATHTTGLPPAFEQVFDELTRTARDVYATRTGCDEDRAFRAVNEGDWTDDRVAAAFLAAAQESQVTFTTRERLVAWVTPQRTFEARLERVLDALEEQTTGYLTYEPAEER